ncbi:WD40 repeat domain-containing serine/threonine protein kinase [Nocardiopsis tropica]|uniref:Serine/threonine-protein kinase n=1 Tax=Nocardiopsis tropica TaxID=109330 RepID=A0ABV1ZZW7_9ACTN
MRPLTPEDPRSVGPYRLLSQLGAGGMGRVYLGRDPSGTAAAVKVVRSEYAYDPGFRARFARETDLARRMRGAFTPRVLDADTSGVRPWMATEYVRGLSLHDLLRRTGPLPESAARFLARGIARALAHMHGAGLVHRDLTPGNVMVSVSGPQVIDFGVARAVEAAEGAAHTGETERNPAAGTPGYTAPEQLDGDEAGPAADVFALAAVLVYACTGAGPFGDGHPSFVAYRVKALEPALTGVPEGLRPLVAACLAKDPRERPTAEQALAALGGPPDPAGAAEDWLPPGAAAEVAGAERRYLDAVASDSAGAGRPGRRRSRFPAVVAGAAALLLLAGAGVWASLVPGGEATEHPGDGTAAEPGTGRAACDLTEHVAPEYAEAARDRLTVPGEETIGLDVYTIPTVSFSADGNVLVVSHPQGVALWDWREGAETAYVGADLPDFAGTPVLSPDGCRLGYGSPEGGMHVFDVGTGEYTVHAEDLPLSTVAFSPDGERAAVGDLTTRSGVHTVDLETGEGATVGEGFGSDTLQFSPDGDRLLLAEEDSLVVVDPADGAELGRIGAVDAPVSGWSAAWGSDGEDLVYLGAGGVLRADALNGSDPQTLVPAEDSPEEYVRVLLNSGSDRLYTLQESYDDAGRFLPEVRVWEYSTGEELPTGGVETRFTHDLAVHPDGEAVAALAPEAGSVRLLDPDDLSLLAELG